MNPHDSSQELADDGHTYLTPGTPTWDAAYTSVVPRTPAGVRILAAEPSAVAALVAGHSITPLSSLAAVKRTVLELIEWSPMVDPSDHHRLLSEPNIALYQQRCVEAHTAHVATRRTGFVRRISRNLGVTPFPMPVSEGRDPAAAPYTHLERRSYLRLFDAQTKPETAAIGQTILAVAAGTGAASRDLWELRRSHIHFDDPGCDIELHGTGPRRVVPVAAQWVPTLAAGLDALPKSTRGRGDLVFNGSRPKDWAQPLLNRIDWADKPRLSLQRLRSTWICDRLHDGCRLDQIRDLLGLTGYSSITAAAEHLKRLNPDTIASALEMFRGETR